MEPKPTRMTIQLTDKSIEYPRGVIEDVLAKVDKFIFPINFAILHLDDDGETPFILGRPFLAISRALIDVSNGRMVLRIRDEEVVFRLLNAMRHSLDYNDTCYFSTLLIIMLLIFTGNGASRPIEGVPRIEGC